jgi:hypothetical protein
MSCSSTAHVSCCFIHVGAEKFYIFQSLQYVSNKFNSSNKSNSLSGNSVKIDCDSKRETEKKIENRKYNLKEEENDEDALLDAHESLSHLTESF